VASRRDDLMAVILSRLQSVSGIEEAVRNKAVPNDWESGDGSSTYLILLEGGEDVLHQPGANEIHMYPSVEGHVRATSATTLGTQLNDLLRAVVKAVCTDESLGGQAIWCRYTGMPEAPDINRETPGAGYLASFTARFDVFFVTSESDLAVAA
jgi:hypothetical protein